MLRRNWVFLIALVLSAAAGTFASAGGELPGSSRGDAVPESSVEGGYELIFVGNKAVAASALRSLLEPHAAALVAELGRAETTPAGETRVTLGAREALLEAYRRAGYLDARVDSIVIVTARTGGRGVVPRGETAIDRDSERGQGGGRIRIAVYLTEGNPAIIGSVSCAGNMMVSTEELTRAAGVEPGGELTEELIQAASERLLDCLSNHGFAFASVGVGKFQLDEGRVSFCFFVHEGERCRIKQVKLENSRALREKTLERALRMKPGELYCESELRNGLALLRRSGLFAEVGEPLVSSSGGDRVTVSVPVKERKATSVAGAVGFRGRTNELTGGLSLSVLNLARTGRSAKASWEAAGSKTSTLRFFYAEPWMDWLPVSSNFAFEHTARDTFFARTSLSLVLTYPVSRRLTGHAGTSFEKSLNYDLGRSRASRIAWLAGAELFVGQPEWLSQNTFLTSLELSRGTRKRVLLDSGETEADVFSTLTGRLLAQKRLFKRHICAVEVGASAVLEGVESLAADELFALGGTNTLRGYSERQFLAATVGSVQFEYGMVVGGEGGRAFVFVDCGYASTPAATSLERVHAGYGIGLRVPSPLGMAGIDLGIPAGESLGSGKVHVGIEGTF